MTSKSSSRVDQKRLARELGVTDRRVRQLVDEFILPPAHHDDGLYDLALSHDRYDLYRGGTGSEWSSFYVETEHAMRQTEKLWAKAWANEATKADLLAASLALQADMARMKFIAACRSQSDAERQMFFTIWSGEEDRALKALLGRGMAILGKTSIVDDETGKEIARLLVPAPDTKDPPARKRRPKAA